MKLYYSKGACSLAVRIVIHELGIKCEFISVDLNHKKTEKGDDFTKINLKGYVPALEIEGKQILTENLVIQQYLADTHQANHLLPPMGDFKRYRVLEWLAYISSELHKSFGPLFNADLDDQIKKKIFIPLLKKKFNFVDKQLGQKKFLMGDHFTLPDAYLFVMLFWATRLKLDIQDCPQLTRYFNELKTHPSIQKSLQEEQLL